ncbi:hypothetical protein DM02DRAFT_648327 [Periconia macrospinosa]|uniref:PWWP domain-containing protein n=1 Tax=Periconia macrospinosa TaxID=97972 RepID=A0A2V1EEY2_9PLEO|nr:hypothetical protein DM02DRAFT_648327 [Periconia macrospinosa]
MAEEASSPAATSAAKPTEDPSHSIELAEGVADADAKPTGDGDVAPADASVEDQAPDATAAVDDQTEKDEAKNEQPAENGEAAATAADTTTATNATPASTKKTSNSRRKSSSGVPEHKSKKTPNKKKKQLELHLDTKPGDMWLVAMRGYQPWPVIICDEDMLPETLLAKRPVSAIRVDGTYREDYLEGGKNAKDRRYPVMFLGTNEFAWQVNTDLLPFDLEEIKKEVEAGLPGKKNKVLTAAYEEAVEGHDLDYYKEMLQNHEQAMIDDAEAKAAKEEEKLAKKEKSKNRKSTAAVESDDMDMDMDDVDDTAASGKKKGTKRKKGDESDGEPDKPAKTPKTKLKLNNKPPKEASTTKPKKETKAKKAKASEEPKPAPVEEPPMTEADRRQKREKSVLYLRHRLQKGFLSRDQPPQDGDMPSMAAHLTQLEELDDLEAEIIKKTKVHKVLKAIIKLNTIPKEEEFNFKNRSSNLLTKWSGALAAETEAPAVATNGVKHDEEAKNDSPVPEKNVEPAPAAEASKPVEGDGDVTMADAAEQPKEEEAAAKTEAESNGASITPAAEATAA